MPPTAFLPSSLRCCLSSDGHLKELGMPQLIQRKKFVGKVLHSAKIAAVDAQRGEL